MRLRFALDSAKPNKHDHFRTVSSRSIQNAIPPNGTVKSQSLTSETIVLMGEILNDGPMNLLAAISGDDFVSIIKWIIVGGLIFWLLMFLLDWLKIGEPFNKVARTILMVAAVLFLINVLLMLVDKPLVRF